MMVTGAAFKPMWLHYWVIPLHGWIGESIVDAFPLSYPAQSWIYRATT